MWDEGSRERESERERKIAERGERREFYSLI
jgi:hypothetical protein